MLNRRDASGTEVDNLSYTYNALGQLASVSDGSNSTSADYMLKGATNYTYDANGNMKTRINSTNTAKNITATTYNYLDLPQSVTASGATVSYVYDGSGRKLRSTNGIDGQTRDYIDGIEYSGSTLELIQMEEGRILRGSSGTYTYEYLLKDHLGNTRSGFSGATPGTPTFGSDYYPFGTQIQSNLLAVTPKNNYLYNGKELQDRLRLLDYGARFYDPVIGRWGSVDPLAEKYYSYSPYGYAINNPLLYIDVDGRDIFIPITKGDYSSKAFSQLQSLTSERLVLLNTGQVVPYSSINPVTDALSVNEMGQLSNTPVNKEFGTELVQGLINADFKVDIIDDGGWGNRATSNVKEGKATVRHNVDSKNTSVKNEDGSRGTKPQNALGHELIHVRNRMGGKSDDTKVKVKDPDTGGKVELTKEEINTRMDENKIRQEQLDKNRAQPERIN